MHSNSGYMAPEYAMEGLCSVKSDVFSFGVLLLEIISGKRNGGFYLSEEGESLLTFVSSRPCSLQSKKQSLANVLILDSPYYISGMEAVV